jgi:integrase
MPKLTDNRIASLKPKAQRYEIFDEPGRSVAVRVGPGGSKSFVFFYHFDGKLRRLTLGNYPKMGLADANIAVGRAHKMPPAGYYPGEKAVAERVAARKAETIDQLCDDYLARHAKPKKRSAAEDERLLEREVRPHWRGKKAKDIRRREIVAMLDRIVDRGSPVTANRTLAVVRRMFNFAIERGIIETSPCVKVKAPHKEKPRERNLSAGEIEAFWKALDGASMETNLKALLRFLLVTGARRGEVAGMHESEIDAKAKQWALPASRSKTGRERLIPLSALAVTVLAEAKPYVPPKREGEAESPKPPGWVFPSGRTHAPYQGRSIDHAMRDLFVHRDRDKPRRRKAGKMDEKPKAPSLAKVPRFTPHDLRRSAATKMRELGVSLADVGLVLGHAGHTVTSRHYDKYEGLPEKKRALDLWGKRLSEIIAGKIDADSNVVDLATARA